MVIPRVIFTPQIEVFLIDKGLNLVGAIVILVVGWLAARWISAWTRAGLDRLHHFDATLKPLLATLVRYAILVVTVIAVLQRFGVETTSLLAVLGAAGLAVGLAVQGTLSNVAAGAMLLMLRPFRVGEVIEVAGQTGTVREISLFTTILVNADQIFVSIPNAAIFGATILNYSREPTRRIVLAAKVDNAIDVEKAQAAILEVVRSDLRVQKSPQPIIAVDTLGDTFVQFSVQCWVQNPDYGPVRAALLKAIKLRIDLLKVTPPTLQQVTARASAGCA
ncbi:MAG: mechanosensitive ion channel [Alphaproteobacteria bacterium]|nr:mechanosensitive ion channel [Alphaproteobacteria bacterium]